MKSCFVLVALIIISSTAIAQKEETKKEFKAGEYTMKQYWFVMLVRGTNLNHDSATSARLQKGHMDNINKMHKDGKLMVAGPFGDKGDWRGVFILDCKDREEAEALVKADPAVAAGRLTYEIRPWWTAKNEVFK